MHPTKFPCGSKPNQNLLNLFATKMQAQHLTDINEFAASPSQGDININFRKERREHKKKLHNLELKLQEECRKNKSLRKENTALKNTRYDQSLTIRARDSQITKLTAQVQDLEAALRDKSVLFDSLQAQLDDSYILSLQTQVQHLLKRNQALVQQNSSLQQTVLDLRQKLKSENSLHAEHSLETEKLRKQLIGTTTELYSTKKQLATQMQYIEQLKAGIPITEMISILDEKLTLAALPEYAPLDALSRRTKMLWRLYYKQQRLQRRSAATDPTSRITEPHFGHLILTNNSWRFQCLDGTTHPLLHTKEPLIHNTPAKADLVDGQAIILKSFSSQFGPVQTNTQPSANAKNKQVTQALPTNFNEDKLQDLHVLIIGARRKNTYLHFLKSHGLNVTWHNPFEESHALLLGKINQADIVLICKRHISHSLMKQIDKNDPKIDLVGSDNPRKLLVRIRYCAIQLSL